MPYVSRTDRRGVTGCCVRSLAGTTARCSDRSICTADRLVRTMVTMAGASLPDAVQMITETPARLLGLDDRFGRVEPGRAADLAVFDHTIRIAMVLRDGAVRYEN